MIDVSGAVNGVSGARYEWRGPVPKRFAHLWFRDKDAMASAAVKLALKYIPQGLLTRAPCWSTSYLWGFPPAAPRVAC